MIKHEKGCECGYCQHGVAGWPRLEHPVLERILERLDELEEKVASLEGEVRDAHRKLDDIGFNESPSGGFRIG